MEVGGSITGWGQQLSNFVNIPITNLASGWQTAESLYSNAFQGVINLAEEGDIVLIECGYNDSDPEVMQDYLQKMIQEVRDIGAEPILITPNASYSAYTPDVKQSEYIREIAKTENCK